MISLIHVSKNGLAAERQERGLASHLLPSAWSMSTVPCQCGGARARAATRDPLLLESLDHGTKQRGSALASGKGLRIFLSGRFSEA